jgi:hypothetical protein
MRPSRMARHWPALTSVDGVRSASVVRENKKKRAAPGVAGLILTLLFTVFVSRLNHVPSNERGLVERGVVWPDTVRRGPMVRQLGATGTLVLEDIRGIADPTRLRAALRIPETRITDIEVGQPASIDTRNGLVPGKVSHIDPAGANGMVTAYVTLIGELPRGARLDMTVDGVVELERLDDVVYAGRPAFSRENSTISIFKVTPGCDLTQTSCEAVRQRVRLGRSSVNTIEILEGLKPGDQVVLSDMSAYDALDRVRLN